MNADQIRNEIAKLEEQLAALAGEPVLIEENAGEGWRTYHRRPDTGALLTHLWPGREIGEGRIWWHKTLEGAKAHLAKIGRESGFKVSEGGLYLEMQGGASAYVTRLGVMRYDDGEADDLGPLSSLKGTDNPIARAAAAGLTYEQARKAVEDGKY